jgi:hypothetical protein
MTAALLGVPVFAQLHDNTEKQLSCQNGSYDSDRARHCEMREQSVASIGQLTIDAGQNGGANIKGWTRGDVLVRTRVEAFAENDGAAANLASRVNVDSSGGQVRATGPDRNDRQDRSSWSVSFEIFVPQNGDVSLKTYNGGINIQDVRGQIHFEAHNGGVNLKRVMGDVTGSTVNGGINVEMAGTRWDGRQMDLSTHNGGVNVAMPAQSSARVQAETVNGRISSDFPMPMMDSRGSNGERQRKIEFAVNGGGSPIHITTQNGGISLKKSELQ